MVYLPLAICLHWIREEVLCRVNLELHRDLIFINYHSI